MKKKSIFKQMLVLMVVVICGLAAIILTIFMTAYEKDIYSRNQDISNLLAGETGVFMDGAYSLNEALAENPGILTMETEVQTPILAGCVENNSYLEQIYIQGTDGMQTVLQDGGLSRPCRRRNRLYPSLIIPWLQECPALLSFFPCIRGKNWWAFTLQT